MDLELVAVNESILGVSVFGEEVGVIALVGWSSLFKKEILLEHMERIA